MPASVTSWISSRPATTVSSCASGRDESLVVRPAAILPARVPGELPVDMGGVVAQDVADAAPVELRRRAPDHVDVDVDRLGDRRPARPRGPRGATPRGGRTRRSSSSTSGPGRGPPRRQAKNFATSRARPPPSPMTAELRQPVELPIERHPSIVVTSYAAARCRRSGARGRAKVGHRDDDVRAVDEVRQLGDESRPKTVTKPCPTVAGRVATALVMPAMDGGRRSFALGDVAPRLLRTEGSRGSERLAGRWLSISLDVFVSPER